MFSKWGVGDYLIVFIAVICFIPLRSLSQLSLNSKAPKINTANWINKTSTPVEIKKKFIVLEFWATWCAPCLGALPHLNRIQNEFKKHKELVFLSVTDENIEKVKGILPRFNFESTIVSDTTGSTHKAFKIESLPITFLIDDNGLIKWIGDPMSLTASQINKFLQGEKPVDSQIDNEIFQSRTDNYLDSLFKQYRKVFDDSKINEYITVTKPDTSFSGKVISRIGQKTYNVCQIGVRISTLFSNLLHCNERQLQLPVELKDKAISYCFKNDRINSKTEGENLLLKKLIQELNINLSVSDMDMDVIVLEVSDSLKLNKAKVMSYGPSVREGVSVSNDLKIISIYNNTLNSLEIELNKILDLQIKGEDLKHFSGNYDITINNSSLDDLQKSIQAYGFSMRMERKKLKMYRFDSEK